MNQNKKVLLAGSTGYLGKHLLKVLLSQGVNVIAIARDPKKLQVAEFQDLQKYQGQLEVKKAEVTKKETLQGICQGIDTVISCVGITRQQDGLTYRDVDYQANINLLREAEQYKVRKFIYISVLNGEKLRHLKIMEAKEEFTDELIQSKNIGSYCVVRPNGFFSDMEEFLQMAKDGTVYLFGDGNFKLNPIHGNDLAKVIYDQIDKKESRNFEVGGPQTFTQNEISQLALDAWGKKDGKIFHVWDWIRKSSICMVRTFTTQKVYGPVEFFMTAMAMDSVCDSYGVQKLGDHYRQFVDNYNQENNKKKK